jgi:uncharacterized membrane protein
MDREKKNSMASNPNLDDPLQKPGTVQAKAWKDEEEFRRGYPLIWLLTLIGPVILSGFLLFVYWEIYGTAALGRLVSTVFAITFLVGKFVILGGMEGEAFDGRGGYTAEELVMLVVYLDVMTACTLTFHIGFLFRLPYLGPRLQAVVEDGRLILHSNRWMKRATFWGLVLFVTSPLAVSGSVGGSILGRLLGMSRVAALVGTILGNVLGCLWMYFGGELITRYLGRDNPWMLIGGIAVIAGIVYLLNRRYQRWKAQMSASPDQDEVLEQSRGPGETS